MVEVGKILSGIKEGTMPGKFGCATRIGFFFFFFFSSFVSWSLCQPTPLELLLPMTLQALPQYAGPFEIGLGRGV